MNKELTEYLKKLMARKEPLTDSQVKAIAYWEMAAFTDERRES